MTVQKAGFVMLEGAASPDATLMLVRGGAIEGTVADVAGDPIWNAVVTALEPGPTENPRRWLGSGPMIWGVIDCTVCLRVTTTSRPPPTRRIS